MAARNLFLVRIRPVECKLLKQRQRPHADLCEYVDRQAVVLPVLGHADRPDLGICNSSGTSPLNSAGQIERNRPGYGG